MAPLDLSSPLPDLDASAPAGVSIEFDADFAALERTAEGTPERQAGDKIIPAEDPDWKDVAAQAEALLERSYDLRVLTYLATARLHLSGLAAFAAVLGATAELLDTRWEHVHPQLDPEDDNDPTVRANALLRLASPTKILRVLRNMPIAVSRRAGPVSWRLIEIALGHQEAPSPQEKTSEAEVRAAFAETPRERLDAVSESVAGSVRALNGITNAFNSYAGFGNAPDLSPLTKLLQDIARHVETFSVGGDAGGEEADQPGAGDDGGAPTIAAGPVGRASTAVVTVLSLSSVGTRAEAVHLLDLAARYFADNEPSSPLPLMIARARYLADKSFLEILQDIAPDGLMQAQNVVQSREG
jgi:type VI secretion system protein ImpA